MTTLRDEQLPIPLDVLRAIGKAATDFRDQRTGGRWDGGCVDVTEDAEAILGEHDISYETYAAHCDGLFGGVSHDDTHHYVVLDNGWIIDPTIRQYIEGPRASAEQIQAASGYPHHPAVPHVAVVPPDHPFVAQMGYESHTTGGGWTIYQPWLRISRDEWERRYQETIKPWYDKHGD